MMTEITKWKVISRISYHWKQRNRIVKPGEMFLATEEEIPVELKRMIIPMEKLYTPTIVTRPTILVNPAPVKRPQYRLRRGEDSEGEFYDILDSNGKVVNEIKLNREEAGEMLRSLKA